jgi:hypothetical protein
MRLDPLRRTSNHGRSRCKLHSSTPGSHAVLAAQSPSAKELDPAQPEVAIGHIAKSWCLPDGRSEPPFLRTGQRASVLGPRRRVAMTFRCDACQHPVITEWSRMIHSRSRRSPILLICLVAVAVAFVLVIRGGLLHHGGSGAFGRSDATTLAAGLTSPSPEQRDNSVVTQLRTQLANSPLLGVGTTLSIDAGTFSARGAQAGTVDATSTGAEPGRWRLYVAKVEGRWLLADTVALP